MIKKLMGNKYLFHIILKKTGKHFLFSIKTICKSTMKSSSINNLNTILSELNINLNDEKYYDSIWILNKQESITFFNTAIKLISHKSYIAYLEKMIDEDRYEGEWQNIAENI